MQTTEVFMKKHRRGIIILSIGTIIYFLVLFLLIAFESADEASTIRTLPDALWYSIVTLTTVGYGDKIPLTVGGKLTAMIFIVASVGLLGAFISSTTQFYSELREKRKMGYGGTDFKEHIIIIGWDQFSKSIAEILVSTGRKVAIVTNNKEAIEQLYEVFPKDSVFALYSDYSDYQLMEKKINIADSTAVFLNLPTDTDKLIAVLNLKKDYPQAHYLVTLEEKSLKETFINAGTTYIISKEEIASKLIASFIFEPDVAEYNLDILDSAVNAEDFDVQQFRIIESNPYLNKTYGEVFSFIKNRTRALLIGISKKTGDTKTLMKLPPDNTLIELHDYLIFITNGESADVISDLFNVDQGV